MMQDLKIWLSFAQTFYVEVISLKEECRWELALTDGTTRFVVLDGCECDLQRVQVLTIGMIVTNHRLLQW